MATGVELRRAEEGDARACFDLFRTSLWDLMRRIGYRPADDPDPDFDMQWTGYETLFNHLGATSAEWWVAEGEDGLAGYARSIEREGLLELTEFFVRPGNRIGGVGRSLLERAFPVGLGTHRSIIATLDAPAVALYLRFGVAHQTTGIGLGGPPRPVDLPDGYSTAPGDPEEILEIERAVLGHGRPPDIGFMAEDRPAVMLRRGTKTAGYAFLPNERGFAGPVATLEPEDLPAALAAVENAAHEAGHEQLELLVPMAARAGVDWLLGERGMRVDPFYCFLLADGPWAQLDRYVPFNPCLLL